MFCKKCGKELPDGTKFCPSCGTNQEAGGSNTINSGSNTQRVNAPNETVEKSKAALKGALELAKSFVKDPKGFISSFMNDNAQDPTTPYAFIACEIVAGLLFAFVVKSVVKSLVTYYVTMFGSSYNSALTSMSAVVNPFYNKIFTTLAIWLTISTLAMWAIRYVYSKLLSDPENQKKVFNTISVFSLVEIGAYLLSIVYAIVISMFGKIDLKALESKLSDIRNSSYSSYSSGMFDSYNQTIKYTQAILGGLKFLLFLMIAFAVIYTLLYIFHIHCMERVADNLVNDGKLESKKAKSLIIVFAIILILINMYFGLFITYKVTNALVAEGMKTAALYGSSLGSMFGF